MPRPDDSQDVDYERVELVWPGKNRPVERVSLPFQTIERVNDVRRSRDAQAHLVGAAVGEVSGPNSETNSRRVDDVASFDVETGRTDLPEWWTQGWRNRLIWGDNKLVLSSLLEEFAGKVDTIYIDPPFATGADFSYQTQVGDADVEKLPSMMEEVAYRDAWGEQGNRYLRWFAQRVHLLRDLMAEHGCLFVHLDWHVSHSVKLLLDSIFGPECFMNEISWKRYAAHSLSSERFDTITERLIYYVKNPRSYRFNVQYEQIEEHELFERFPHIERGVYPCDSKSPLKSMIFHR